MVVVPLQQLGGSSQVVQQQRNGCMHDDWGLYDASGWYDNMGGLCFTGLAVGLYDSNTTTYSTDFLISAAII
jgi:hypothetical protein